MLPGPDFLVFAHRGASAELPENTLPAFRRAADLGADGIELDVQCCEDELVVIHDDELDRTTNGHGAVADRSLSELRALDAGGGAPIPLLSEVLDAVGDRLVVNVELKGAGTAGPAVELLTARAVAPDRVLLSAFDHDELVEARRRAPRYLRGALFGRLDGVDPVAASLAVAATTANLALRTVTEARVRALRAAGLEVLVYTVNEIDEAFALRALGVRGVFTDRPRELLAALGRPARG
jgi:glycerophosphoryl diester phosphodiesterase